MGHSVDLPEGPSGRIPQAGIELADFNINSPSSILVLFQDGAIGVWEDGDTSPTPFYRAKKSYDGSEYDMILHTMEELGKIEENEYPSRKSSILLWISLTIGCLYLALYLYVRSKSDWPRWFADFTEGYREFIFVVPVLIWYLQKSVFKISAGEISLFPLNSDPYRFPIQSHNSETIIGISGLMFALAFGCAISLSGPELYFDVLLVIFIILIAMGHFISRPFQKLIKFGKTDSSTPIFGITGFMNQIESLRRDIAKKTRMENPLIELLMANESPTLEFKGSLWASYHGVTGKLVEKQKEKNDALEDAVLKTVAAFLNTSGGTLLIGIKDKPRDSGDQIAEVLGIEPDFRWLKKGKQDTEGYEHVLIEIFNKSLSNSVSVQYITISFPVYESRTICRIDVDPLPRRVGQQCFATTKTMGGKKLFVRSGDSTIPQSRETEYDYIRHHFEGFSGKNNES